MKKIIPIIKKLVYILVFVLISLVIAAFVFNNRCKNKLPDFKSVIDETTTEDANITQDIKNYKWPEDSTYLTFPEWYLVFNPQEYGEYITKNNPSNFPYIKSIGQFWGGYCSVYGITKRNYPFNAGDHVMEVVIGTSFTVEYVAKGVWENTIGRLSEQFGGYSTEEDAYAAQVAVEYGQFIPTEPWYLFPYGKKLTGLWKETDLWGTHPIRKWERKIFLSSEYAVKTIYAWIIKVATHSVYGYEETEIYAHIKNAPIDIFDNSNVKKIKDLGNGSYIVTVPHYQGFTDTIPALAYQGVEFVNIAGNNEILVTVVVPKNFVYQNSESPILFTMNMMSSDSKRLALQVPVKHLRATLVQLKNAGVRVEHLFDF